MKSSFLFGLLISLITVVGCSTSTPVPSSEPVSSPSSSVTPEAEVASASPSPTTSAVSAPTVSEDQKISAEGIGPAKIGMTYGELKKVLGTKAQFKVESPFIVDFDAIAVSQSGKVQFHIIYPAGTTLSDASVIGSLRTENPDYQTEKGVGPGTPLKQVEVAYGKAKLSYNLAVEGREYVSFANQPAKNISFRLGSAGDNSLAGNYPSSGGEYQETEQYKENAKIRAVEVNCQSEKCAQP